MATLTQAGITFGDGTSQTTAAVSSYVGGRGQIFTSSGTFTIPTGVTAVKVTVQGGGGNGGGASGSAGIIVNCGGGGGGSGGFGTSYLTGLTPGGTIAVTVGGVGGASSVASGTQAITTITASGGSAGATGSFNSGGDTSGGGGGAGGACTGAQINIAGVKGAGAVMSDGGPSFFGNPGMAQSSMGAPNTNGNAATGYGAGGGGALHYNQGGSNSGGAGGAGIVVFEW